jgi:hypothetical protein
MTGGKRTWVAPLAIGLLVLGAFGCAGLVLVAAAGGAAYLTASPSTTTVSGPIAVRVEASTSPRNTPTALRVEGAIAYAEVTSVAEPPPARFAAPLPASLDDLDAFLDGPADSPFPPFTYVSDLACAGDGAMDRKVLESVRALHRGGANGSDVEVFYGVLYRNCDSIGPACPFLLEAVSGNDPAPVKEIFWNGLEPCEGPAYDAAFERPDVPPMSWVRRQGIGRPPWSARLERMVSRAVKEGTSFEARQAAMLLGADDDPRRSKALLALHASEPDPAKKRALGLSLYRQTDPAGAALFRQSCDEDRRESPYPNPVCAPPAPVLAGKAPLDVATSPIGDLLADHRLDVDEIVAANEKARDEDLVDALARCTGSYSDWKGRACLSALATFDWKRAAGIAARMSRPDGHGAVELRQALRTFDDRASLLARLRKDGVLSAGDPVAPRQTGVRELLVKAGRLHELDLESGTYPNEHDSVMRSLAALARPELDGILFLETPPPFDEASGEDDGSPYGLDAWIGGRHWRVDLQNEGDWYDVDRCLGLLNRILEERGSAMRFVSLRTDGPAVAVVAGDRDGLERLASDRLLLVADPSSVRESGRAFEQQGLDALRREDESR